MQAFINTHYDLSAARHGDEVLCSPGALVAWLADRELISGRSRLQNPELSRAVAFRETLRALADGSPSPGELDRLNELARGAAVEVRFRPDGPRFVSADELALDGAIGVLSATVAAAMIDGSWSRMKVCPGHDCGWAFYDHSRNQAGRWCSMSICGARAKARAHYRRRRRGPPEG